MDLSSLVHAGRTHVEQQYHHQDHQPRRVSSLMMSPYTVQNSNRKSSYSYINTPQPPPSPPADETPKCSLPSISSLLGMVDTPSHQNSYQIAQPYSHNGETSCSKPIHGQTYRSNYFDISHQKHIRSPPINPRGIFPLTPPLHSDSGFEGRQSSPSTASNSENSVSSMSNYDLVSDLSHETSGMNSSEHSSQRQAPLNERRVSIIQSRPRSQSIINNSDSHFRIPPHQRLNPFHPNSIQASRSTSSEISGLSYQRPLPQEFSPSSIQLPASLSQYPSPSPWQHHHYISPSSTASFPQTQDRYICQTCNKAFSRPSSLRIHSYSHTGAKPFKCPHLGCGKAFSVRSNMKRHERGCHNSEGSSV